MTITSPSNVSPDNPHRTLLENIRIDLIHVDEEKLDRIVYNVERYLSQHPDDDPEFISVLNRILEVVKHFEKSNEIIFTPEKPIQAPRMQGSEQLREKSRQLFDLLNQHL